MGKNWLPGRKKQVELPKEPRTTAELDSEYTKLCSQAGQLSYELKSKEQLLMTIYSQISDLIREGDARKKLDAAKAQEAKSV